MRELGERAATEREGQIAGSRRIGIGLSSSSPPNFNWELTRFPVRCNSRRDATRRPPSSRREGESTLVTIVTSSGEILGVLGHRPRIIYLYVGRWIRHRSSDSSLFLGEEGAFRSRSEIPRYGDRREREGEKRWKDERAAVR